MWRNGHERWVDRGGLLLNGFPVPRIQVDEHWDHDKTPVLQSLLARNDYVSFTLFFLYLSAILQTTPSSPITIAADVPQALGDQAPQYRSRRPLAHHEPTYLYLSLMPTVSRKAAETAPRVNI